MQKFSIIKSPILYLYKTATLRQKVYHLDYETTKSCWKSSQSSCYCSKVQLNKIEIKKYIAKFEYILTVFQRQCVGGSAFNPLWKPVLRTGRMPNRENTHTKFPWNGECRLSSIIVTSVVVRSSARTTSSPLLIAYWNSANCALYWENIKSIPKRSRVNKYRKFLSVLFITNSKGKSTSLNSSSPTLNLTVSQRCFSQRYSIVEIENFSDLERIRQRRNFTDSKQNPNWKCRVDRLGFGFEEILTGHAQSTSSR